MTDCKINFTEGSDQLAYGIYQDMLEAGDSCDALDHGYNVTNYAGLYCPAKDARSCVIGKGDGVVEADEVKEYALDKEYEPDPHKYEQYRKLTEGRLGDPLPWVLDDLDPNTTFDAEIRERVQAAIDELKRIIKAKGVEENSERYKEMLAAGLTWFVATLPIDKATGKIVAKKQDIQRIIDGIEKDGLEGFWGYLEKGGGIRVEGDYSKEYTALEALRNSEGECTEISKILFAAMKMAGLRPVFIYEDILKEETNDPIIKEAIESMPTAMFHLCVGLYIGKRIRLFDSMFINSNANYKLYTPLSLRQYLSFDYNNRGGVWRNKGKLDSAIADYTRAIGIDPRSALAYTNCGIALGGNKKLDEEIADHTRAIEIDPKFEWAYYNRAAAWVDKGEPDNAMTDFTRMIEINPKSAPAYNGRGVILAGQGKLDEAIAAFTRAIEIDSKDAGVYYNCGLAWYKKGKLDNAIATFAKTSTLDHALYHKYLLGATKEKWQSTEGLKKSAGIFWNETGGGDISEYEARFVLAYALWEFKRYEEAQKTFNGILTYRSFKVKPSKSTTDFFNGMLRKMPATMKKDKGVQEILKSLREKMK